MPAFWHPFARSTPEQEPDPETPKGLLQPVDLQASTLTAVARGGPRVDDVNARYKRRRIVLDVALRKRGIEPPFPFEDLWGWYGYWGQICPAMPPDAAT